MGTVLADTLTLQEAADMWDIEDSTLRHAIKANRFYIDEIRKANGVWLVAYKAMLRLYKEPVACTNVYTIGYEGKTIEQFISELNSRGINVIVDVRAAPLSRKRGFSKTSLMGYLENAGIEYQSFSCLGTPKPIRNKLYETHDYQSFFLEYEEWLNTKRSEFDELNRIISNDNGKNFSLMCFEADPNQCHRKVIAEKLLSSSSKIIDIHHI